METMRFYDGQELKEQMREELGRRSRRVLANLGEGGAVLAAPGGHLVLQTTFFVEDVHFELAYTAPREVGHKALAAALSSLAALGARPLYGIVGLGLRQEQGEIFVAELLSGAAALAKKTGVDLAGQCHVPSPSACSITVTVAGEARKYFSPRGARPGDWVCVSGALGSSAAGLTALKRMGRSEAMNYEEACAAHLTPQPRLGESEVLRSLAVASAAVDIRDGFTRDLYRLAEASGVGVLVEEGRLPIGKRLLETAARLNGDARAWMLYGAEDFGLIYTVPARHWPKVEKEMARRRLPAAVVGTVTEARDKIRLKTVEGDVIPLLPKVWHPFARRGKTRWR